MIAGFCHPARCSRPAPPSLIVGVLASAGLDLCLIRLLCGVKATDPATLAWAAPILGAAAPAANYLPARRARSKTVSSA